MSSPGDQSGVEARAVAFELDLDALIAAVPEEALQVTPVSTFPVAKEDLALVVDAALPAGDLVAAVTAGARTSPAGAVERRPPGRPVSAVREAAVACGGLARPAS